MQSRKQEGRYKDGRNNGNNENNERKYKATYDEKYVFVFSSMMMLIELIKAYQTPHQYLEFDNLFDQALLFSHIMSQGYKNELRGCIWQIGAFNHYDHHHNCHQLTDLLQAIEFCCSANFVNNNDTDSVTILQFQTFPYLINYNRHVK